MAIIPWRPDQVAPSWCTCECHALDAEARVGLGGTFFAVPLYAPFFTARACPTCKSWHDPRSHLPCDPTSY